MSIKKILNYSNAASTVSAGVAVKADVCKCHVVVDHFDDSAVIHCVAMANNHVASLASTHNTRQHDFP